MRKHKRFFFFSSFLSFWGVSSSAAVLKGLCTCRSGPAWNPLTSLRPAQKLLGREMLFCLPAAWASPETSNAAKALRKVF